MLLFDTCERLNELASREVGKWLLGKFLPELHANLGRMKKACFVVMASRGPLEFDMLQEQEQQRLKLDLLHKDEVFEYLDLAGLESRGDQSGIGRNGCIRSRMGTRYLSRLCASCGAGRSPVPLMMRKRTSMPSNPASRMPSLSNLTTPSPYNLWNSGFGPTDPALRTLTEYAVVQRSFNRGHSSFCFPSC